MDELRNIPTIASWEAAKHKRSACKGKLTRLIKQLEEASTHTLSEQRLGKIVKLHDDLCKEIKLFNALQNRCEQLLEAREGVTDEMIAKEIESGETLHQADEMKATLDLYLSAQSVARDGLPYTYGGSGPLCL